MASSSSEAAGRPAGSSGSSAERLAEPDQHLLLDVDVEVDLDRLVRRLDRDAASERQPRRRTGRRASPLCIVSASLLTSGWWGLVGVASGFRRGRSGSSLLVVLSTSTLSAGESTGNGITGAITCVGSLKPLVIWMSARNGPLMFTLSFSGSLLKARVDQTGDEAVAGPERYLVDGQLGRELAGEVAVEADDHRAEADVAQQIDSEPAVQGPWAWCRYI